MNSRLGKARFNSLNIILDSIAISFIIISKNTHKLQNKMIKTVHWSTQGGDSNTNHTIKVEILLPELDA